MVSKYYHIVYSSVSEKTTILNAYPATLCLAKTAAIKYLNESIPSLKIDRQSMEVIWLEISLFVSSTNAFSTTSRVHVESLDGSIQYVVQKIR